VSPTTPTCDVRVERSRRGARARARRRAQRGFTLIELTIALLAGLIVALAIMGLSRDSTRTFHEEMRASSAEANLRTAVDRLRSDLSRAAYMSTGDIQNDPMIARAPGAGVVPGFAGLSQLSAIQLFPATSAVNGLTLSGRNGVDPVALQIGGNMTSTDQFAGSLQPAVAGGCEQIFLNPQTPAMFRVLNSASPASELNNLFQPVPNGVNAQFMVRVFDKSGHSQFLVTCPGVPTGLLGGAPNWQPFVLVAPATPVLTAKDTNGVSSLTGFSSGDLWVNPVQIVRWEIMAAANEPAQYTSSPLGGQPLAPTLIDPTKYDLVRSYVDAVSGLAIPQTTEIIAEYAVDFDVAFSVDNGVGTLAPNLVTFPFDDPQNALSAPKAPLANPAAITGPARIRSVRARLVTRTAQADRTLNVAVPGNAGTFMYRYCILPGGCDPVNATGVLQYARARTLTIEVALSNQSRSYFF
jgi:prepilin-type N-terminal cleavage/methylation domain-containing protein